MASDRPVSAERRHWPMLVFEDGDGDLVRCDCGEQGYDFKQGREWFAGHLVAQLRPPEETTDEETAN